MELPDNYLNSDLHSKITEVLKMPQQRHVVQSSIDSFIPFAQLCDNLLNANDHQESI